MYAIHYDRLTLLLLLVLLGGCATPAISGAPSPTVLSTPSSNQVEPPSTVIPVATQTLQTTIITPLPSLPTGWHRVEWQGFSILLPSEATNIIPLPAIATNQIHQIPILAAGSVALPPVPTPTNGAIGEYPAPPSLTLLQFTGTLEEWITLEEQALAVEEGGVSGPIEALIIAGQQARHYRRTVSGFNYNDYYILKPTETTLLLIYTDKEAYSPLVDGLAFAAPQSSSASN